MKINSQKIISTINQLPLTQKQKQLCLKTLKDKNYNQESLIQVVAYLESLARLRQAKAINLESEINIYDQLYKLSKQSTKTKNNKPPKPPTKP